MSLDCLLIKFVSLKASKVYLKNINFNFLFINQDLNLSTERLSANKAFTNKLWNAGKFILQNLPNESDLIAWKAVRAYEVGILILCRGLV